MFFEFRKGSNGTVAVKNICIYSSALDFFKCQMRFSKLISSNFDLSNSHRLGGWTTLDNDVLRAEVEANPYQIIEKLMNTLNQPCKTIQEHL